MKEGALVVTAPFPQRSRAIVAEELEGVAEAVYLADVAEEGRASLLSRAAVLLSYDTAVELRPAEFPLLENLRLIQFTSAGIDWVPLRGLPPAVAVASNAGATAEPMAEHVLALALAAAKRLFVEHANLKAGEFNQFTRNRMLRGGTCGILGFGGVGKEAARLLAAFGMRILAINRSGESHEESLSQTGGWVGTLARLDELLDSSDLLLVSLALTPATLGVIGARQLARMKEDAILVNVSRGEIIDEKALYEHLLAHPKFTACIDAWWVEPVRHRRFEMTYPFLDLANVIASPHNSAGGGVWRETSLRRALANCRRVLTGQKPLHLLPPEERMM